MTAPFTDRACALEIAEAARVALNTYLDIEIACVPKRIWDLIVDRALPLVVRERDVATHVGQFLGEFDDGQGDWPHRADDGRYYVSRRSRDEDAGEYLDVDRRYAFETREDCHRYIVAGQVLHVIEGLTEDLDPVTSVAEFDKYSDRLGYSEIAAFRTDRVGGVDTNIVRAA